MIYYPIQKRNYTSYIHFYIVILCSSFPSMFVQYQDFLINVLQKALPCHPFQSQPSQKYFMYKLKGSAIYFRRVLLPELDFPQNEKIQIVKRMTNQLEQELLLTQANISKYILKYEKIIFSYPYACFFHDPFEKTIQQIIQNQQLEYCEKIKLALELSKAVKNLNDKKIYIRSLNPTSIGINRLKCQAMFQILLTEPSTFLWVGRKYMNKKIKQNNGYVAPEIFKNQEGQSIYSCDIWSIGIIIYEILFEKIIDQTKHQRVPELVFPKWAPQWLRNFLLGTLKQNPKQRFSINDVVKTLEKAYLCSEIQEKAIKGFKANENKKFDFSV